MIFEGKFRRALEKVRNKNKNALKEEDYTEDGLELEKHDLLAMMIAGVIVILPIALIIFAIMIGSVWFFFFR
ncbi:hypothetical protein [Anaeromicropila herbilytica]|uniref:Uncharacterized protein n=1 Tax=Anaeromicropila herbilytica TaxID=2785025 RepID=A0A7R7EJZ1_9FIRM|nr:hypothetical protein [Anaeromicropila herbilytica]BCN30177.1 hypothetical protein bsdtb5_14720 [Anaeromicropila herbilytica]